MKWTEGDEQRWLYCTDEGEAIALVMPHGGLWAVHYKGSPIAIRPTLGLAKRAAELCHSNCE